jgi:protein-S-isoprenylcysteine O-methyltransferase Ste14
MIRTAKAATASVAVPARASWLAFGLAPLLVLYVQERIIKREEGYLSQRFGPDYINYRKKVRRLF